MKGTLKLISMKLDLFFRQLNANTNGIISVLEYIFRITQNYYEKNKTWNSRP